MTCIVGLVHDDTVYMGGDSCGSNRHTYTTVQDHKVFPVGEHVIGCTGTFRLIDLLRYGLSVDPPRESEDPERYARGDLLDAVVSALKAGDYLEKDNGVASFSGPFLVGWRGRLWSIQGDLSVLSTPPWGHAVGSGDEAARASLHTTRQRIADPVERVRLALEAAEAVVTTVRGPHRVWRLAEGQVQEL